MSNKIFTTVPVPKFPRSTFNLSRPVLFTPRMHKEYPTEILEVIPGDGFKVWAEAYAKSFPMVAPTFAKSDVCQEAFFVPCWQVSERFDDFITGGERGMNTDKMPFLTVDYIYTSLLNRIQASFGLSSSSQMGPSLYNERLEYFQSILEGLDIMRAIPVVVPDFQLMPSPWDNTVSNANIAAFTAANSHLNNSPLRVNLLPFGCCLKAWCEYYRDENLVDDLYSNFWLGEAHSGAPNFSKLVANVRNDINSYMQQTLSSESDRIYFWYVLFGIKNRAWKKDYFTSALPFVQKGPDVVLPLDAAVKFDLLGNVAQTATGNVVFDKPISSSTHIDLAAPINGTNHVFEGHIDQGSIGTSIQDVRTAFKLEEMYEADGRFGSRYPENTLGQFGVHTPDSRLPRCQYLGGNRQPIQIQQVIQNSQTDSTPQGNLAGLSSSYGSNRLFKTYQSLHGFIVSFTAIRVHALYEQGIHPMFSRYDRTEYAWPRFAHLGEQAIYLKQLYVNGGQVTEDAVFGYTPRYADYKSDTGSVHGKLKGSLNVWTMSRRFGSTPLLNEQFIYSQPRQDAFVVANPLQPCFVMELDYHVRANRLLPFYGQPHM